MAIVHVLWSEDISYVMYGSVPSPCRSAGLGGETPQVSRAGSRGPQATPTAGLASNREGGLLYSRGGRFMKGGGWFIKRGSIIKSFGVPNGAATHRHLTHRTHTHTSPLAHLRSEVPTLT